MAATVASDLSLPAPRDLGSYEFGPPCGVGGSSVVHVVRRTLDGRRFACKIVNADEYQTGLWEVDVMRRLAPHDGIMACVDAFQGRAPGAPFFGGSCDWGLPDRPPRVCIVTELMAGSDLLTAINARGGSLGEGDARRVMVRLLDAIGHVHRAGLMHRDIKLENVLVESPDDIARVRLADFGFAAVCDPGSSPSLTYQCGTPLYVAPEVIAAEPMYGNKADMWSLGVALFMMLNGFSPFSCGDAERSRVPFDDPRCPGVSREAEDLVRGLLKTDPAERLSAEEALSHPWIVTRKNGGR